MPKHWASYYLVTSFLNCCLEAKGMSQYTDPFVAHPFQFSRPLAEHRRHQKKHCQVSATKSCMASFSQGRFVERLGSRKSPTSLAAKGFIYIARRCRVHGLICLLRMTTSWKPRGYCALCATRESRAWIFCHQPCTRRPAVECLEGLKLLENELHKCKD